MSGHKMATVTISQEEYRKLYEAEKRLQYSFDELNGYINKYSSSDDNQPVIEHVKTYQKQVENNFLQSVADLPNRSNINDHDQIQRLFSEQINLIEKNLIEKISNLEEEIPDSTSEIEIIAQHVNNIRNQLDDMNHFLSCQSNNRQAQEWTSSQIFQDSLREVNTYLNLVLKHSYPQFTSQSELNRVEDIIEVSLMNKSNGLLEAATTLLQGAIVDIKIMWNKILLDTSLFIYLEESFSKKYQRISRQILNNHITEAVNLDGSNGGVFLDLYEWCDGKYSKLIEEIQSTDAWLETEWENLSFNDLYNLGSLVDGLSRKYQDAIITAHTNAINSQLKYEVANQVLLALIEQGYKPVNGEYQDREGYERYYAKAENAEGNSIEITIDDDPDLTVGNKLTIYSSDFALKTNYELRRRGTEIREAVQRYGLEIGEMVEVPPSPEQIMPNDLKKKFVKPHTISMNG